MYQHSYVPSIWKEANVLSFPKPNDTTTFRPISLTSILARILERLVKPRLVAQLEPHLSRHQFGFRSNRCTLDNLSLLQAHLFNATGAEARFKAPPGNPPSLPVAFLDLAKAFDKVHLPSLLFKLSNMGVTGKLWAFIRSFTIGRRFRTIGQGLCSDWMDLECGVPQGSVLGPILFLAYINDLATEIETNTQVAPSLYADDLALIPPSAPPPLVASLLPPAFDLALYTRQQLQDALDICTNWATKWRMKFQLSHGKSNLVVFSFNVSPQSNPWFSTTHPPAPFLLSGAPLLFSSQYKYMGVILRSNGSFDIHTGKVVAKTTQAAYFASRLLTPQSHINTAITLSKACVAAIPAYALPFYTPSASMCRKVDSALAKPIRKALYLAPNTHVTSLLTEVGVTPLRVQHEKQLIGYLLRLSSLPPTHPTYQLAMTMIITHSFLRPYWSTLDKPFHSPSVKKLPTLFQALHLIHSTTHWDAVGRLAALKASGVLRFTAQLSGLLFFPFPHFSSPYSTFPSLLCSILSQFSPEDNPSAPMQIKKCVRARSLHYLTHSSTPSTSYLKAHASSLHTHRFRSSYLSCDPRLILRLRARLRLGRAHTNEYRHRTKKINSPNCEHCTYSPTIHSISHILLDCPQFDFQRLNLCHALSHAFPNLIPPGSSLSLDIVLGNPDPSIPLSSLQTILSLTSSFISVVCTTLNL